MLREFNNPWLLKGRQHHLLEVKTILRTNQRILTLNQPEIIGTQMSTLKC